MNSIEHKAVDVIDNYYNYLLSLQNVIGLGYGYKHINYKNTLEPCIAVFVKNKMNIQNLSKNNIIPKIYMGINTDVLELKDELLEDDISSSEEERISEKLRPLEGGCSVGFIGLPNAFGTICCIVKKLVNFKFNYYILSNNHVLADNGNRPIGTIYTQPLVEENDFNSLKNAIAILDTFIPIHYIKQGSDKVIPNFVDCAIAQIIDKSFISNKVKEIGSIRGTKSAKLGMHVKKVGCVTGVTYGEIEYINFTSKVKNENGVYLIKKQILTNIKTKGGDSGSPVLTAKDNYMVGMHSSRAYLTNDISYSRSNDINLVLKNLKVKLHLG